MSQLCQFLSVKLFSDVALAYKLVDRLTSGLISGKLLAGWLLVVVVVVAVVVVSCATLSSHNEPASDPTRNRDRFPCAIGAACYAADEAHGNKPR